MATLLTTYLYVSRCFTKIGCCFYIYQVHVAWLNLSSSPLAHCQTVTVVLGASHTHVHRISRRGTKNCEIVVNDMPTRPMRTLHTPDSSQFLRQRHFRFAFNWYICNVLWGRMMRRLQLDSMLKMLSGENHMGGLFIFPIICEELHLPFK